jgi:plasmid stabilization system protein ParE
MIQVEFTLEAKEDLFEAVEYYEAKELGLGKRLRDEVSDILQTAATAPYLWRLRTDGYRRINCPIFPYYIAYVIRDESLVVIAIASNTNLPGYWHSRLQ